MVALQRENLTKMTRSREDKHKAKEPVEQTDCSVGEMKLLVGRQDKKHAFCHLCKCKRLGDDRIVDKVMRSISDTENTRMLLKIDGEPTFV